MLIDRRIKPSKGPIPRHIRSSSSIITRSIFTSKILLNLFVSLAIAFTFIPIILYLQLHGTYSSYIYTNSEFLQKTNVAIVFGATAWDDGPSPVLKERLDTAVDLYNEEKVDSIIVSGDNRDLVSEPIEMYNYLLERGVPETNVIVDYYGIRTYDTCYRAKNEFRVNEAILVTQEFHMIRSLYLCNALGVDSVGYIADKGIIDYTQSTIRDFFALQLAIWDINFLRPEVAEGNDI